MACYGGLQGILTGLTKATCDIQEGTQNIRILHIMISGIPLILGLRARMSDPSVYVVCWPLVS